MRTVFVLLALALCVLYSVSSVSARALKPGECEVCLKCIQDFKSGTKDMKKDTDIEDKIRKICNAYKDLNERRFCYYIGGTDDAATSMLREISRPIKNHLPNEKICERLNEKDDHICTVKYRTEEKPDYSKTDFTKLTVRELKNILQEWGEKCDGCTEKSDFVALANKVKSKHAPPKKDL
jgi:hypothetical protein